MQRGREACRVGVPVEDVERWRLLAEQPVVDDVGPDQVVRAQPEEHAGQVRAVEVALAGGCQCRCADRPAARHRVDDVAALVVDDADAEGEARDPVQTARRGEVAGHRGREQAAGAVADEMRALAAADLFDRVEGLEHACRILVEAPVAMIGGRIPPRDREHLLALRHQVLDEALSRREIRDVELVDHRRDDQQGRLTHLRRHRPVLDQLESLIAHDDRAGAQRQVLADLELGFVDVARQPG
jgi:hypothetical protein